LQPRNSQRGCRAARITAKATTSGEATTVQPLGPPGYGSRHGRTVMQSKLGSLSVPAHTVGEHDNRGVPKHNNRGILLLMFALKRGGPLALALSNKGTVDAFSVPGHRSPTRFARTGRASDGRLRRRHHSRSRQFQTAMNRPFRSLPYIGERGTHLIDWASFRSLAFRERNGESLK
jgi:hypothetical protein